MTLQRIGGYASLGCAATYLFGFAFLVTLLAPLGYGTSEIDVPAVVAFTVAQPAFLILWNTVIYIVNAMALIVLVVALKERLVPQTPGWGNVGQGVGIMWAALVLGAGMIANVATERTSAIGTADPEAAAALWEILHAIELGLGGGNEIAGGVWIGLISVAAWKGQSLGKTAIVIGLITSAGGIATLLPPIGDAAGAVFGLGAIAWFIATGISMLRSADA